MTGQGRPLSGPAHSVVGFILRRTATKAIIVRKAIRLGGEYANNSRPRVSVKRVGVHVNLEKVDDERRQDY